MSGLVICCTAWVWYTRDQHELKSALLIAATTLASPHLLDYDLVPLAPALAFLTCAILKEGLREYELSLMAFIWIAPLLARTVAGLAGTPLGLITTLTLFSLLAHRSLRERPLRAAHAFGVAQL